MKCYEQLFCVSLLLTALREREYFPESLGYYLTFSMELSPSHDFNSDKSIKYISVECILKYHKSNQDKPLNTY